MKHNVRKIKKLGRPKGARVALYKGLLISLIEKSEIETTISKAKGLRPQIEHLVSIAKRGGLSSFRNIIGILGSKSAASKMVKDIAPKYMERTGGFVKIQRTRIRSGDAAQMAKISWVLGSTKLEEKDQKTEVAKSEGKEKKSKIQKKEEKSEKKAKVKTKKTVLKKKK